MAEQFPLYSEEFDGNDFCASQMLATVDDDAAGCMRIRWFGDFAKIERVAVRKEYRRYHLGTQLVRAGVEHCRRKGYRKLYAHSRADLVPLWRSLGWREIDGPAFRFADIDYREIALDIEPATDAIRFGADPLLLLRPEGRWDELGPFDRTQLGGHRDRAHLIERFAGIRRPRPAPARRA
jgi:GNAT superfamily N-acetyltransferase